MDDISPSQEQPVRRFSSGGESATFNTSHGTSGGETDATCDDWRSVTDRKTKKRIQNRVAQRTYRSRLKQRIKDLQQQVNEHEKRQQAEQQPDDQQASSRNPSDSSGSGNSGDSTGMKSNSSSISEIGGPGLSRFTNQKSEKMNQNGSFAMPSHMNAAFKVPPDFQFNRSHSMSAFPWSNQNFDAFSPPNLDMSGSPIPQNFQPMVPGSSPTNIPTYQIPHHPTSVGSSNVPESSNHPNSFGKRSMTQFPDMTGSLAADLAAMNYPVAFDDSIWKAENSPADARLSTGGGAPNRASIGPMQHSRSFHQSPISPATMSMPPSAAAAEGMEDVPGIDARSEEKFEYLLNCAQRVGFKRFDALIREYYIANFDTNSPVAFEQSVSRERHLPIVLGQLRLQSPSWTSQERRGYQEEILKSAEEICAAECREFRKRGFRPPRVGSADSLQGMSPTEKAVQDSLPNLWALLASLSGNNNAITQHARAQAVLMSMQLLCGIGAVKPPTGNIPPVMPLSNM